MWTAAIAIVVSEVLCRQVCAEVPAKFVAADECGCVCIDTDGEFLVQLTECWLEKLEKPEPAPGC